MRTTVDATILYKGKRYQFTSRHYVTPGNTTYIFLIESCTVVVEHSPGGTATVTTIRGGFTLEEINDMNLYHIAHEVEFAIGEEEVDEYVTKHIDALWVPGR